MSFGARLTAALETRGALCVGIDPHPALLEAWGLPDDVTGLARFAEICVEAFGTVAAVVKPQSAFFEVYGSPGIAVLERTVAALRDAGALVLLDVKRGDIGTTMAAYARAYLAPEAALAVDAITVSPYLGAGSLEPAFALAAEHGKGVFVLALTSNPEGAVVQQARGTDGRSVAQTILDDVARRNAGRAPLGDFGVVVGATIGPSPIGLNGLNGPYLVPGIGAQGATADDVQRIFATSLHAVLPSMSREILGYGPSIAALQSAVTAQAARFAFLRA